MAAEAQAKTTFSESQYSEAYPEGVERHYWHLARNRAVEAALRSLAPGCVLDVGCGRGILVEYLSSVGLECLGVELADDVPLSEAMAGRIYTGIKAESLPAEVRDRVRTIIVADVLEHLPDPAAFLLSLRGAFPKLAYFLVTVPARQEIWSNYDEHYGHILRYDRPKLAEVLTQAGAKVLWSKYFFRMLYPPALALALLKRKRAVNVPAPGPGAAGIHKALSHVLSAWDAVMPGSVAGASIIAVAALKP